MTTPSKIKTCCSDPNCKTYQGIVDFLWVWGMSSAPKKDRRQDYFEYAIPAHWNATRRQRFADALRRLPKEH